MKRVSTFWVTVVVSAVLATFGGAAVLNKGAFDAIPRLPVFPQSSEAGEGGAEKDGGEKPDADADADADFTEVGDAQGRATVGASVSSDSFNDVISGVEPGAAGGGAFVAALQRGNDRDEAFPGLNADNNGDGGGDGGDGGPDRGGAGEVGHALPSGE